MIKSHLHVTNGAYAVFFHCEAFRRARPQEKREREKEREREEGAI